MSLLWPRLCRSGRGARCRAALAAAVLASVVLASCSPGDSAAITSTTSSAAVKTSTTSTTTTTTTTTTLPVPIGVLGTHNGGKDAFLGQAQRVKVVAVPEGLSSYPLPLAGTAGFESLERVAFRRFGSGPDLLMITGVDASMTWWDPTLLSLLAQHYRVTIFDLPGTGYSSPLTGPVSLAWFADETAGLIQSLGLEKPAVLGWGLGGDVALALAARHRDSVSSLVLADTPALGSREVPPAPEVRRLLAARWENPRSVSSLLFSSLHEDARYAWLTGIADVLPDSLTGDSRALLFQLQKDVAHYGDPAELEAAVKVPVLLLSGELDRVVPPANTTWLSMGLPRAHVLRFAGGDYGALFEFEAQATAATEKLTG
ncbi:MAG: alpha/beta fold hydrolase [Acidimicrobiales bacterium]